MRRRVFSLVSLLGLVLASAPAAAQQIAVDASQNVGTALAFSVEPSVHFVNTMAAGGSEATLVGDGLGLGASVRGMLFPMAQSNGALGFGLQAGVGYHQLFNAGSGVIIGSGGLRYVLGAPRTAYWFDVNAGGGVSSDSNIGAAPYLDVGIGWQFASAPTFMWGIAGRWSFFFPNEQYTAPDGSDAQRNYSLLSLALILEWGPPRWQEPTITPVPIAMGPTPVQSQPVGPTPIYTQPQPGVVQPQPVGPGPAVGTNPGPGPAQVQQIPVNNPGPANYSNVSPNDQDHDGIGDEADQCASYAEDMNGRDDNDGCPDADRDADGVPDVLDQCPGRPEDFDGTRDEDGCPD